MKADNTGHFIAYDHWHKKKGFGFFTLKDRLFPDLDRNFRVITVDQPWLFCFHHTLAEFVDRYGLFKAESFAALDQIAMMNFIFGWVIQRDQGGLRVEYFSDLVTDQVDDGLKFQFGCQSLLHAVDDRQFRVAFLRLFEQALGFVKQTGILERHAHGIGKSLQQAYIRFTEGVLAFHVGQADQPARLVPGYQWHHDQ